MERNNYFIFLTTFFSQWEKLAPAAVDVSSVKVKERMEREEMSRTQKLFAFAFVV